MPLQHLIDDGYTQDFYIAARPGLWDELEGKYRPMLPRHRDEVDAAMMGGKALIGAEKVAKAIALHVKEWSILDANGCQVSVSLSAAERLRPGVSDRLYGIISGRHPSDLRPGEVEKDQPESVDPNSLDAMEAAAKN